MGYKARVAKGNALAMTVGLAVVGTVIIAICSLFVARLNSVMFQESRKYLEEVSSRLSSEVDYRVSYTFTTLESIGETYLELGEDVEDGFLAGKAKLHDYVRIGVVDKEGVLRTTDGKTVPNVGGLDSVREAMRGTNVATNRVTSVVDGRDVIMYAVPLKRSDAITGVLCAWITPEQIDETLSLESFRGNGYSFIVDLEGNFVARSANPQSTIFDRDINFYEALLARGTLKSGYSLDEIRRDIRERREGFAEYVMQDGVPKMIVYLPLSLPNWCLLSVVPTSVATQVYRSLMTEAVLIVACIVLLFAALIAVIVVLNRRNRKKLADLAYVDPVTGGFNRQRFELEAREALKNARPREYALVSADLKRFKLINDTFGSAEGDRTLRYVFDCVRQKLGEGEFAARLSADTFNLFVRYESNGRTAERLEGIAAHVNRFNDNLTHKYFLPMKFGVYIIDDTRLDLITIQDRANVARKSLKSGSAKLCSSVFYSDLARLQMVREKEMEDRMNSALEDGEFTVYLQPKIGLCDGRVGGAEALVRWQDPERGLIQPDDFVPLFERNGFIVKIDLFVFEQVCKLLAKWRAGGKELIPISVNLSRAHLRQSDFLKPYREIAARYGVPPGLLELELTETMVFEDLERLMQVIDEIRRAGFLCSLDDFGSGYSSLNVLKDVHVDVLKLDRQFLGNQLCDEQRGRYVIQSVVELAKKLGMQTVSEGVETPQQVEFLKRIDCDLAQGYIFSKPVPAAAFERLAFGKGFCGAGGGTL